MKYPILFLTLVLLAMTVTSQTYGSDDNDEELPLLYGELTMKSDTSVSVDDPDTWPIFSGYTFPGCSRSCRRSAYNGNPAVVAENDGICVVDY